MKRVLPLAIAGIVLTLVAFAAGAWWTGRAAAPARTASGAGQISHYTCPMHPQYHSDHAGDCPSCGMRLEPVYVGAQPSPGGPVAPPGSVQVSAERQQAIGVRLGVVERVSGTQVLRTSGRIAPNENAVYPLVAGSEGWVREVREATTGALVKKGQPLLSIYSPEFVVAQQSFFSSLDTLTRVSTAQTRTNNPDRVAEGVERYANTLRNLGVSEQQLADMRGRGELSQFIRVVAPVDGFVLARNASVGLRFDRGFEFFRIADLRKVWILADVYENQLPFIRAGSHARITSPDQNRSFEAMVSRAEPTFDDATRTLKVRLETDNPGLALKPGMFVDVEFQMELPASLAVPADAIVDTGMRKTVFVERGNGYFEPRQVESGWRLGGQVEIVKGLMAGERIVISGTFLIDSESRMRAAAAGIYGEATKDPVCGMDVDQKTAIAAGRTAQLNGHTYYFCSDECRHRFEEKPERFGVSVPQAASPQGASRSASAHGTAAHAAAASAAAVVPAAKDLVCGMDVDPKDAAVAARKVEYRGKAYYFCSDDCKAKFQKNPADFLK
jgi:membrane fusion protein, copper/silver efflux system